MPVPRIYEQTPSELAAWCAEHGHQPYRAQQIIRAIFARRAADFAALTELPAALRELLAESFSLLPANVVRHQVARDATEKLLLELDDGAHVECVLMREDGRRSICISTQVGCAMGCVFCASGMLGLKRNLSTGEILEQVLRLDRLLPPGERITNVVVMGIGEPLANLAALLPALDRLGDERTGLGLGARRITVSTVGLPEKIRELARHGKPYNLAVSLHAPDDDLRTQIVPVNERIGVEAILGAAAEYFRETGRRISYEYVLLAGVNDAPATARRLAARLKPAAAASHVNLIPMNGVGELPFAAPAAPRTQEFQAILQRAGIAATVRKRKGADIDAACGQLRLHQLQANHGSA